MVPAARDEHRLIAQRPVGVEAPQAGRLGHSDAPSDG